MLIVDWTDLCGEVWSAEGVFLQKCYSKPDAEVVDFSVRFRNEFQQPLRSVKSNWILHC